MPLTCFNGSVFLNKCRVLYMLETVESASSVVSVKSSQSPQRERSCVRLDVPDTEMGGARAYLGSRESFTSLHRVSSRKWDAAFLL